MEEKEELGGPQGSGVIMQPPQYASQGSLVPSSCPPPPHTHRQTYESEITNFLAGDEHVTSETRQL